MIIKHGGHIYEKFKRCAKVYGLFSWLCFSEAGRLITWLEEHTRTANNWNTVLHLLNQKRLVRLRVTKWAMDNFHELLNSIPSWVKPFISRFCPYTSVLYEISGSLNDLYSMAPPLCQTHIMAITYIFTVLAPSHFHCTNTFSFSLY